MPDAPTEKPKVVWFTKNTEKAWYEASQVYGPYDGHPGKAIDENLESGGNSDYGEPIVSPFAGVVVSADVFDAPYGGIVQVLSFESLDDTLDLNLFHVRHLSKVLVKRGDLVEAGQEIGAIGGDPAHAHVEMCVIPIPSPKTNWTNSAWKFINVAAWFKNHGLSADEVKRLVARDGK